VQGGVRALLHVAATSVHLQCTEDDVVIGLVDSCCAQGGGFFCGHSCYFCWQLCHCKPAIPSQCNQALGSSCAVYELLCGNGRSGPMTALCWLVCRVLDQLCVVNDHPRAFCTAINGKACQAAYEAFSTAPLTRCWLHMSTFCSMQFSH